jgi:hypothetical protein
MITSMPTRNSTQNVVRTLSCTVGLLFKIRWRFTECLDCIEDTMEGELSSDDKVSLYVRSSLIISYGD